MIKINGFLAAVILAGSILPCRAEKAIAGRATSAGPVMSELVGASQAGERTGEVMDGSRTPAGEAPAVEYTSDFGPWRKDAPPEKTIYRRIGNVTFVKPESLTPKKLGERATNTGCEGFFYCLGSALTSPILLPLQGMATGAQVGMETAVSVTGKAWPAFLALGPAGLLGLAVGAVLASVGVVTGIAKAIGNLFKDKQ